MMEKTVNLIYCGGDDAYEGILFSLLSVMRRTRRRLFVTVMTALLDRPDGKPVERAKVNYLRGLLRARRDGSDLSLVDMSDPLSRLLKKSGRDRNKGDPRQLLPLLTDRCGLAGRQLCLAHETLAPGDVGEVFDYPLDGRALGAVRDGVGSFLFSPDYVNAGVLLFDMEKARKCGFFEKARAYLCEARPGATLGNAVNGAGVEICPLPRCFNEQGGLRRDTVVRQYCRRLFLTPYPHLGRGSPQNSYDMPRGEYRRFERVYEEFLLQREGRNVK